MRTMLTRLIAMLLALLMLGASAAVAEEPALRGYDKKDGYVYLQLGEFTQTADGGVLPVIWRVLAVEEDRAFVVSEYVLEARRIHHDDKEWENTNADFTQTELWDYMNNEFAGKVFTEEELALIVDTEEYGRLFLLTSDNLKDKSLGFGTDASRKAWGTEWAKANGLFVYRTVHKSHSPYWTMTQSSSAKYAARCTKAKGDIGWIRVVVADEGMRPACYLDMTQLAITGGAGTLEDPYTIAQKVE